MTFRAAWTLNDGLSAASATAPGTIPATVQAGDVLAVVAVENTGTATYTISGGGTGVTWHLRSGPDDNSNAQRTYVWTAVASASSAGATVTVTSTVSSRLIGAGFAVSGVTESSILIALTTDTTSDTSLVWPSVTIPSGGSAWELYSLATMRASTVPNLTTPPSGTVRDAKAATAFGSSPQFCALALHQTAQTPAGSGATSFGTATADIAVTNNLYTIAFQTSATSATVTGAVATVSVAAPVGSVTAARNVTTAGPISAPTAAAPAGSVTATRTVTLAGLVATAAAISPAGTAGTAGAATLTGPAAHATASAAAGTVTASRYVTLSGPVAAATATAPAGTVAVTRTVTIAGLVAAAQAQALAGAARGQGPTRDITVAFGPVTGRYVLPGPAAARTLTATAATRTLTADPQE